MLKIVELFIKWIYEILHLNTNPLSEQQGAANLAMKNMKLVKLDNGAQIFLIHDKNLQKSAIRVEFDAGIVYNPDDMPGLANLSRFRILSRLREKWTDIQDDQTFFSENSNPFFYGFKNLKSTVIQAETANEGIESFIDDLTDNFPSIMPWYSDIGNKYLISSLYNLNWQYERNLIKGFSEYKREPSLDNLFLASLDSEFPAKHRLFIGSIESFNIKDNFETDFTSQNKIKDRLKDFIRQNYGSDKMKVTICSNRSLEELETIVGKLRLIRPIIKSENPEQKPIYNTSFPSDFKGNIVNYGLVDDTDFLDLYIHHNSKSKIFKYEIINYLDLLLKDNNELKEYIKEYKVDHKYIDESIFIQLKFKLPYGMTKIDEFLSKLHGLIKSSDIKTKSDELKQTLENSIKEKLKDGTSAAEYYSEIFSRNSENFKPEDIQPFNPKEEDVEAMKEILQDLTQTDSWTVFIPLGSSSNYLVRNYLKNCGVRYENSRPIKIITETPEEKKEN